MKRIKWFVVAAVACYLLAAAAIVAVGLNDHIADADMIVVPGNTVAPDGTPSPRLRARLDEALLLYRAHRAPLVFVSGGVGKEGVDEAQAMARYLVLRGVPSSAIICDSQGVTTAATADNASRYMSARGLKSALVVTQYFHIARTRLALERRGIQVVGTAHARYAEMRDIYSTAREVIGFAAYYAR